MITKGIYAMMGLCLTLSPLVVTYADGGMISDLCKGKTDIASTS